MARKPASLPHPVIGVGDDSDGELLSQPPDVDVSSRFTTISINELRCTNAAVGSLLAEGRVEFVVRVECGSTFFRQVWKTTGNSFDIQIPSGALQGTVDVTIDLAAKEPIDAYRPTGLNAEYGDESFSVEAGALLAGGLSFYFDVGDSYDPLSGSAASLIRIRGDETDDAPMRVDCEAENHVIVWLSRSELRQFEKLKGVLVGVIHTGIVFPALIEAIAAVRDAEKREVPLLPWQLRLKNILETSGVTDHQTPLTAAALVLKRPFWRAATEAMARLNPDD